MPNTHRGLYIIRLIATIITMVYNIVSAIQVFTSVSVNEIFTDVRYRALFLALMFALMFWWIAEKEYNEYMWRQAKPIIKLKEYGFEFKKWKQGLNSVVAFIDVFNEPRDFSQNDVNAQGVYPTIVWSEDDGKEVDSNSGRWFIPNLDQEGAIGLKTVDLDANGLSRKLHFAYISVEKMDLRSLWRNEDGLAETREHVSSSIYRITISLRDNKNAKAEFYFRIVRYMTGLGPYVAFRLERLNKSGKLLDVKVIDSVDMGLAGPPFIDGHNE